MSSITVLKCNKLRFEHLLTILLAGFFIFNLTMTANAQEILKLNPAPYEENGTVMVPMRGIFEWLGAEITYQGDLITAVAGDTTIQIRVGEKKAMVGKTEITLTNAPVMKKDTTFVPLRFVSEAMGAQVEFDSAAGKITITKGDKTGIVRLATPQETGPYNYNKLLSFALKEEKLGDKAKESGDNKSARNHYEMATIALERICDEEFARNPYAQAADALAKGQTETANRILRTSKFSAADIHASSERSGKAGEILKRIEDKMPKEDESRESAKSK